MTPNPSIVQTSQSLLRSLGPPLGSNVRPQRDTRFHAQLLDWSRLPRARADRCERRVHSAQPREEDASPASQDWRHAGYVFAAGVVSRRSHPSAFTAIGTIKSGKVYQFEMSPEFKPYRVDVEFSTCKEAPIKPLIEGLSFIRSKTHWGGAFRFGYVKVPEADFALIADAMKPTSPSQNGA